MAQVAGRINQWRLTDGGERPGGTAFPACMLAHYFCSYAKIGSESIARGPLSDATPRAMASCHGYGLTRTTGSRRDGVRAWMLACLLACIRGPSQSWKLAKLIPQTQGIDRGGEQHT